MKMCILAFDYEINCYGVFAETYVARARLLVMRKLPEKVGHFHRMLVFTGYIAIVHNIVHNLNKMFTIKHSLK
jgi:hypothetical protein